MAAKRGGGAQGGWHPIGPSHGYCWEGEGEREEEEVDGIDDLDAVVRSAQSLQRRWVNDVLVALGYQWSVLVRRLDGGDEEGKAGGRRA